MSEMQLRREAVDTIRKVVDCCSKCGKDLECHHNGVISFESLSKCDRTQVKEKYERLREIQAKLNIKTDAYGQAIPH